MTKPQPEHLNPSHRKNLDAISEITRKNKEKPHHVILLKSMYFTKNKGTHNIKMNLTFIAEVIL